MRFDRLSVQNLVSFRLNSLRRSPSELTKIIARRHINPHIRGLPRRIGQTPHGARDHLGRSGVIFEVEELDQVAVLLPALDAHVLVLLGVVLVSLHEAHAVETRFQKGAVVAAAAVAIEAVDKTDGHLSEGVGRDLVDMAAEVAARAVVVTSNTQSRRHGRSVLGQRRALAEEPNVVRVRSAVCGFGIADHVEVDHGGDVGGAVLVRFGEVLGPQQALLFACEGGEDDGG